MKVKLLTVGTVKTVVTYVKLPKGLRVVKLWTVVTVMIIQTFVTIVIFLQNFNVNKKMRTI